VENLFSTYLGGTEYRVMNIGNSRLGLRKVKQLLSNFEAERWEKFKQLEAGQKNQLLIKKTLVYQSFKLLKSLS